MDITFKNYRLSILIGGVVLNFESDKLPSYYARSMASIIFPPGTYPAPLKDRFGLLSSMLFDKLPTDRELQQRIQQLIVQAREFRACLETYNSQTKS